MSNCFIRTLHQKFLKHSSNHFYRQQFLYPPISRLCHSDSKSKQNEIAVLKYEDIPISNIRNFSIIAHIDHGKSTLADRILELTGTVDFEPGNAQVLDRLQVERERGITVKAVTASIQYRSKKNGEIYLLNLVDTPGHVDFTNEVGRALEACQSAVLLIDANQGVQAQTYANFFLAFSKDLIIIPVINKIDLITAKPEVVESQLKNLFDIERNDVMRISAKLGTGVIELLEHIVNVAPPPQSDKNLPLKALLFDSWFNKYDGIICILFVKDGSLKRGDTIVSNLTKNTYIVKRIGILRPNEIETNILNAGQVGFISCNMRTAAHAVIGDTFYMKGNPVEPLSKFKPTKSMVFAGIYPIDSSEAQSLRSAIEKLTLTDSSVTVTPESSPSLGPGWRLGFLGLLHMDVFNQRLSQEHGAETIMTTPNVVYKIRITGKNNIKKYGGEEVIISNPASMPDEKIIVDMQEPIVLGTIITPNEYLRKTMELCVERRGVEKSVTEIDSSRAMLQYILPLNEVIIDFHDKLKNITSGYASFDYEENGYAPSSLVKVDILINGNPVEELGMILHRTRARLISGEICMKLSQVIPRQQFKIIIQAAVAQKIIARETIKHYRKDVTQKLYGGDETRKMKLLRNQAKAKERMRLIGKVEIPRDSFIRLMKTH